MSRILDATATIVSLATHTNIVVTHRAAPTFTNGVAVAGATTTATIPYCVIVPSSGKELQRLPEGRRATETRTIYTPDAVLVGAQAGVQADLVTIDGVAWEVQLANDYPAATGFYEAYLQLPAVG